MLEPESRGEAGFRTDLQRADGPFHDSEQRQCELDCTTRRMTPLCGSAAVASWSAALPQHTLSLRLCRNVILFRGSAAVVSWSAALPQWHHGLRLCRSHYPSSAALLQWRHGLRLCRSTLPLCGSATAYSLSAALPQSEAFLCSSSERGSC